MPIHRKLSVALSASLRPYKRAELGKSKFAFSDLGKELSSRRGPLPTGMAGERRCVRLYAASGNHAPRRAARHRKRGEVNEKNRRGPKGEVFEERARLEGDFEIRWNEVRKCQRGKVEDLGNGTARRLR